MCLLLIYGVSSKFCLNVIERSSALALLKKKNTYNKNIKGLEMKLLIHLQLEYQL